MKTPYLDTEINLIEGYKENKVASFYQIRKLVEYREIKQLLLHGVMDSKRRLEIWDNGYKQGYEDGRQGKQKHKDLGVY